MKQKYDCHGSGGSIVISIGKNAGDGTKTILAFEGGQFDCTDILKHNNGFTLTVTGEYEAKEMLDAFRRFAEEHGIVGWTAIKDESDSPAIKFLEDLLDRDDWQPIG